MHVSCPILSYPVVGAADRTATRLISVPGSPSGLRLQAVSASWARLQWSPPSPLAEHIVSYEVYWNDTYTRVRRAPGYPVPTG